MQPAVVWDHHRHPSLGSDQVPKTQQQAIYAEDPRPEVRPFIPSGVRRALDVGCGRGGFGRTLREVLPPDAFIIGMDAVQENVDAARLTQMYNLVLHGYFPEDVEPASAPYDLITFLDVLEHMVDPWTALGHAREHLAQDGRILASIPNIQVWTTVRQLLKGRWDYTDTGTLDRTHLRFFTKATIIEMFESAGLEVELCEGVNSQMAGLRPVRRYINRRLIVDMRWIPLLMPDSRWLQFVVVARKSTSHR